MIGSISPEKGPTFRYWPYSIGCRPQSQPCCLPATRRSRQSQARTSGPSERNSPSVDRGHTCSLFEGCSLTAESSIRRYRFGSYRCKRQSTRDECVEAWLDTERDEMVRSRRGTVA